jgi:hypothetical protein
VLDGGIHWTVGASASSVRQMPPPAEATHSLQSPGAQVGSIAIAATRPDSCVVGPSSVTGSKNWDASPATFGVTGPSSVQRPGDAARAASKERSVRNALRGAVPGARSNALRPSSARRSST